MNNGDLQLLFNKSRQVFLHCILVSTAALLLLNGGDPQVVTSMQLLTLALHPSAPSPGGVLPTYQGSTLNGRLQPLHLHKIIVLFLPSTNLTGTELKIQILLYSGRTDLFH
jgi:hypothetical protein